MEKIFFDLGKGYEALVGGGASALLGETAAKLVKGKKLAIITDSGVPEAHISACKAALEAAGFTAPILKLAAGEENKRLSAVEDIFGFLYDNGFTRADAVAAVGGGVVGDTAGFAAAAYLRGIGLIHVPTTLLSQVDSAYGGKTGVDFRAGKNHIGAFYHPLAVLCDTAFLRTLPAGELKNGMGEVIKYGAIADHAILRAADGGVPSDGLIAECADIKRRFVEADERDTGERRVLNFGHTYGHAIEETSGFTVPHGQAVAYGMLAAVRLGERLGVTAKGVYEELGNAIIRADLDADYAPFLDKALPLLSRDKKFDGSTVEFVLIESIGRPVRMKLAIEGLGIR